MTKLEEISKAKPAHFGPDDVLSMAATNVFAGSDTTAISMRAIIHYCLKSPQSMDTLVGEIDREYAAVESGITKPQVLPFDRTSRMPYLQAVMYEALRLHPVVGQTLPRVVPVEGMRCAGLTIPGGVSPGP